MRLELMRYVDLMSRLTLKDLMTIYARAAAESIAVCSDTFRKRWAETGNNPITVQIGNSEVTIPGQALEPDAYPYPEALEFETAVRVSNVNELEVVNEGRDYPETASEIKVLIRFSFGAIPEAYALAKDKHNSLLSNKLDQLK